MLQRDTLTAAFLISEMKIASLLIVTVTVSASLLETVAMILLTYVKVMNYNMLYYQLW